MEKRLVTNSFDQRFMTTFICMLFVNVFMAHRYYNDPAADFKEQMNLLAYRLMHNPHLPETTAQSPPSAGRCSPCGSGDGEAHTLFLQSKLYKEFNIEKPAKGRSPVQRCIICNAPTSWAFASSLRARRSWSRWCLLIARPVMNMMMMSTRGWLAVSVCRQRFVLVSSGRVSCLVSCGPWNGGPWNEEGTPKGGWCAPTARLLSQ
jgi:hypothetical protein